MEWSSSLLHSATMLAFRLFSTTNIAAKYAKESQLGQKHRVEHIEQRRESRGVHFKHPKVTFFHAPLVPALSGNAMEFLCMKLPCIFAKCLRDYLFSI